MKAIFGFLFRNTARKIARESMRKGVEKGFTQGMEYQRKADKGCLLYTRIEEDIAEILERAGF